MTKKEKKFNEYLELARKDEKLVKMETKFHELKEDYFRINNKNENLTIEQLMVKKYIDKQIAPLRKRLNEIEPTDEVASQEISNIHEEIASYENLKSELIEVVEADFDWKTELSNFKKKLFVSIDGKEVMLTSVVMTDDAKGEEVFVCFNNITKTVKVQHDYIATKALQTCFSDASDYLMYNVRLDNKQLLVETVNINSGKSRFYGVLGHKKTK
jgi:hypothetical protein